MPSVLSVFLMDGNRLKKKNIWKKKIRDQDKIYSIGMSQPKYYESPAQECYRPVERERFFMPNCTMAPSCMKYVAGKYRFGCSQAPCACNHADIDTFYKNCMDGAGLHGVPEFEDDLKAVARDAGYTLP